MYFDLCLRLWSLFAQSPVPVEAPVTATASPAAVQPPPVPAASTGLGFVQYILMVLYLLVSLGLIAAVMSQTSKNEGLSGMLGGGTHQSVFRGKKTFEETLSTVTNYLAWGFLGLSVVVSLFLGR